MSSVIAAITTKYIGAVKNILFYNIVVLDFELRVGRCKVARLLRVHLRLGSSFPGKTCSRFVSVLCLERFFEDLKVLLRMFLGINKGVVTHIVKDRGRFNAFFRSALFISCNDKRRT